MKRSAFSPCHGGTVVVENLDDGRIDLSLVAPQGHSTALYLTNVEAASIAGLLGGAAKSARRRRWWAR